MRTAYPISIALSMFLIVVLFLDFAALDDITTGNETNYVGEYGTLAVSIIIFGVTFLLALRRRMRRT